MDGSQLLSVSPLDSTRFGIKVVRGTLPAGTPHTAIATALESTQADLAIVRTEAGDCAAMVQLQRAGWPLIHADTLLYYGIDLGTVAPAPSALPVRLATAGDRAAIAHIAERSFDGYRAHYAANPLLPPALILAGYIEWANSRLGTDDPGACTWVICQDDGVAGFATCDIDAGRGLVDIVLNAVHPDHARQGLYGQLLKAILGHYASVGMRRLTVSTQVWNVAVQRRWTWAGLRLERAMDTYHIDRRLAQPKAAA